MRNKISICEPSPIDNVSKCESCFKFKCKTLPHFLAGTDDESIVFCICILPDLWADLTAAERIFFHIPRRCQFCSLLCAVDLEPYLCDIPVHLHHVIPTNRIPLTVCRLPLAFRFWLAWRCGDIIFHCSPVIS